MLLNIFLIFAVFTPSIIVAYFVTPGKNKYWMSGLTLLNIILLIGANSLVMDLMGIKMTDYNLLIAFGLEGLICIGMFVRQYHLSKKKSLSTQRSFFSETSRSQLITAILLLLFMASIPIILTNEDKYGYTEFYLEEGNYQDSSWRRIHPTYEIIPITITVRNHELDSATYKVQVFSNTILLTALDFGIIEKDEGSSLTIFLPPSQEPQIHYTLVLHKDGIAEPYRHLSIWIKRE